MQNFGNLVLVFMNRRHNDVRRRFVVQLNDKLAQIGFQGLDAVALQKFIQVNFF